MFLFKFVFSDYAPPGKKERGIGLKIKYSKVRFQMLKRGMLITKGKG